jgi:cell division protein FtsB|tara:strand:+ start:345 stop:653 length:309 start_codon:yes stop_codon:yes gene_type:complete
MNKLYYLLIAALILIIIMLSKGIFFGENSYSKRAELIEDNKTQEIQNQELKRQNKILEFEIKNAQNSNDHVENFAREKLNLTYKEEEFISFKEENKKDDDDE